MELLGPAGSGKTTLVEALRSRGLSFRDGVRPCDLACAPLAARALLRLPPGYALRALGEGRAAGAWWTPRDTLRSMVYLEHWMRRRGDAPLADGGAELFDHGPLFRLGTLWAWGPPRTARFVAWWEARRRAWQRRLSLVVWLDAPDRVLVDRIRRRDRPHPCREMSDAGARGWLEAYRAALRQSLAPVDAASAPEVVEFDTAALGAEAIATALAPRLGAGA